MNLKYPTRRLPVELSMDEKLVHSSRIVSLLTEIKMIDVERREVAKDFKRRIDAMQAEFQALTDAVASGYEFRDVEVRQEKDAKKKEVRLVRIDTDDVVSTRPMEPCELPEEGA